MWGQRSTWGYWGIKMGVPDGDPTRGVLRYEDWQATEDAQIHGLTFVQFVRALALKGGRPIPPFETKVAGSVDCYVNHGRWVADCPAGDGGALLVSADEPLFWCLVCGNKANGGAWYVVRFPQDAEQIEALLSARSNRNNRNWGLAEDVAVIAAENAERGIKEPA